MINEFGLGGKSSALSDKGYLTGGTVGTGSLIDDFPVVGATGVPRNPITAGNRSGDGAFSGFNLDTLLASGGDRDVQQFSRAPGVVGLSGVIDNTTMQVLMRGMDQNKGADILATPSITTRSGQAASITMIREFIYASEYEPPQIPQSVNSITPTPIVPSTPSAFETRDTGVFMEVLPTVDENRRYIDVAIKPVITDFDGFVNYGSPINFVSADGESVELTKNAILQPVFSVKKVDSSVVVADGATIVIGGLLKDTVTKLEDKTPILGSIPMLGRLFKSEGVKHNSTAILFFVNVELVDPTGKPYRER
jgi:general secretion pathway protein D